MLRNFCINLSSWNNYDSWFFSFSKNIRSWNFKFDSLITNHELLIQTLKFYLVHSWISWTIFHSLGEKYWTFWLNFIYLTGTVHHYFWQHRHSLRLELSIFFCSVSQLILCHESSLKAIAATKAFYKKRCC